MKTAATILLLALLAAPFAAAAGMRRHRLLEAVGERLGRFFGKRGESVVRANLAVISEAWDGLIDVTGAIPGLDPAESGTHPQGVLL